MSDRLTFKCTPAGPVPIPPLTEAQRRSMDAQQARMFTPDGQLRRVIELREAFQKGLFKPGVGFVSKDQP